MKEERSFIVEGISAFREKYALEWQDLTVGIAGDVLQELTKHKVIYALPLLDYALFHPQSKSEAESIAAEFAALGCRTDRDTFYALPGVELWIYVFSPKVAVPAGPCRPLPESLGWETPFKSWQKLDSAALPGEVTPFVFKGERYRLENVLAHFLTPGSQVGSRHAENHFRIRRESDDRLISIPLLNHYFCSAFVWNGRCYCFAQDQESGGSRLNMISSDDLISWTAPECILDLGGDGTFICNSSVTFDGERFVLLYECNDPRFPVYTFRFLASADLVHWERLPDALCVDKKYGGGPALYWINGFYYVTFVDLFIHPLERRLAFRTSLTRSRDLIHWEEAPEERPVLLPDFSSRPDPEGHPDIYDVNASDAEFIQEEDKVRVYYISGNQWGVSDNRTALFTGSLQELFESRFS